MSTPKQGGAHRPTTTSELPDSLLRSDVIAALDEFTQHRRELKKPLTPTALSRLLKQLSEWGPDIAVEALHTAVARNWRGVFLTEELRRKLKAKQTAAPDWVRHCKE